jgi:hypothetical protein
MTKDTDQEKSESAAVRAEFDEILMRHVSSLIDTREDIAALPFNLATISSLLLLADRENEIKSFPDSPPDRYNRDSFLEDIEEIGLDLDEDALSAFQDLERYGFVMINSQEQYAARESASLLIMVLDAIFPQMPGMNLVAYVSQAIEEVLSGRKEKDQALQSFDQTLGKQGVHLSATPEDGLASSAARRIHAQEAPDPEALRARREAYLQRLKKLRAKSLSEDAAPSVLSGGTQLKNVKIREFFRKEEEAPEPELPPVEAVPPDAPEEAETDRIDAPPAPDDAFETPSPEPPSAGVPVADTAFDESDAGIPLSGEHRSDAAPSPPDIPLTEPATTVDTPSPISEKEAEKKLSKEELIERQIRQFEDELAMPCPICGNGKVLSDTTEKGKTYYHCSNEDCRLISWGKPYNMACPSCKNPFLIEVPGDDDEIGLKCPRATCGYRKKSIAEALSDEKNGSGKRKVAVVKKKRKKGVRRVVRRKT